MRTALRVVWFFGSLIALNAVSLAQSDTKAAYIKERLKELYGSAAPADITFVGRVVEGRASADTKSKTKINPTAAAKKGKPTSEDPILPGKMSKADKPGSNQTVDTKVGDVVRGVIVGEKDREMYLDKDPCSGKIVTFIGDYRITKIGTVRCGDKTVDRYEVAQK